jgi:hypothetical protein
VAPSRTAHKTLIVALVAASLGMASASGPRGVAAAPAGPMAIQFWSSPSDAYLTRPFNVQVAIVDSLQYPQSVVTSGTSATVTLTIETGPDPLGTLTCASGLSMPTTTTGTSAGIATFTGCTFDRVGTYGLVATATNVVSTAVSTPVLADARAPFIHVGTAIEAPQDTIKLSITHDGTSPYFTWGQTVTIRVTFTAHGATQPFLLQQTTRAMTDWVPLTNLVTNASGVATYSYRPSVSTHYRVVFAGTPDLAAGTSERKGFLLFSAARQSPANATPRVIRRGTSVTFATTVRPLLPELAPAHVSFAVSHRVSGEWKVVAWRYVTVDSSGVARMTLKFGGAGEWYVRSNAMARWFGDSDEAAPAVAWASRPTAIARYSVR